jgi:hypothetical protein
MQSASTSQKGHSGTPCVREAIPGTADPAHELISPGIVGMGGAASIGDSTRTPGANAIVSRGVDPGRSDERSVAEAVAGSVRAGWSKQSWAC